MDGILNIDKPAGMTSHDVVQAVRRTFGTRKVGHLGTLDPMATGVLPICLGKATRVSQYVPGMPKEYEGEARLGFSTTTYDREGIPTSPECTPDCTVEQLKTAMAALTGPLDQLPPPFSAKKIGGTPAYALARRDRPVTMTPSRVEIREFEMTGFTGTLVRFRVVCSPGTYIRSLAHDLGQRLGCGAHLTALRRLQSGEFRIENAVELDHVSRDNLIAPDRVLKFMPRMEVSDADEAKVAHGNRIRGGDEGALVRIFNKKGEFIAIGCVESGWVSPRVVLT